MESLGKTLIIENKQYGLRFYEEGSRESYFLKDYGDYFVMIIEEDREAKDMVRDIYENLGVRNIYELLEKFKRNPSEIYEMLTGKKVEFDFVLVEDEGGVSIEDHS